MSRSLPSRLALLASLYLVQGLPFGFQATALPVLLRQRGTSLEAIGFAGALALPWMGKLLVAPFVDARWSARLGRRRSWILPLQLGLVLTSAAASFVDPSRHLFALMVLVLAMNACAATMDIAVDGLAIDLLRVDELGPGNAAQVVGFKLGMITSGGLLLAAVGTIGWRGLFLAIAAIAAAGLACSFAWREPEAHETSPPTRIREVFSVLMASAREPGAAWLLAFIGTYKIGEAAADAMFKPFLVDAGYDEAQIGLWVGTYGMIASLAGSLLGGLLARRVALTTAVALAAVLRAGPMIGQCALALFGASDAGVIAVTLTEHAAGGALTTAMFAFMMSRVDRRIGATHYTALATVEVLGKAPAGLLSGVLAASLGYAGVFGVAAVLSVAFLALLVPIRASARRA